MIGVDFTSTRDVLYAVRVEETMGTERFYPVFVLLRLRALLLKQLVALGVLYSTDGADIRASQSQVVIHSSM